MGVLGKRCLLRVFLERSVTSGRQAERGSWGWGGGPVENMGKKGHGLLSYLPVGMVQLVPGTPWRVDSGGNVAQGQVWGGISTR